MGSTGGHISTLLAWSAHILKTCCSLCTLASSAATVSQTVCLVLLQPVGPSTEL